MGHKFFRQYGIGEYIADFYCPEQRLAIEIDGSQHYTDDGREYDESREKYMISLSIKTIRFSNLDVLQNIEGVLSQIEKELELPLTPSLTKEGAAAKPGGVEMQIFNRLLARHPASFPPRDVG
jgi:very-short-patch-repair endonuclease